MNQLINYILVAGLLLIAFLLFLGTKRKWIKNESLQTLAQITGIVTFIFGLVIFIFNGLRNNDSSGPKLTNAPPIEKKLSRNCNDPSYISFSEEQIRTLIDKYLQEGNPEGGISIICYLKSTSAKDEELWRIFGSCLQNGKLETARRIVSLFTSATRRKEAEALLVPEEYKLRTSKGGSK